MSEDVAREAPTSEEMARAALRASVLVNHQQMALTEESRQLLAALLRDEMRMAVSEGIKAAFDEALTEQNARRVFQIGVDVLQEQAARSAGMMLWSGVKGLFRLAFWPLFLLVAAFLIGGPGLFKVIWAAVWKP
jgi:hypothetical protein